MRNANARNRSSAPAWSLVWVTILFWMATGSTVAGPETNRSSSLAALAEAAMSGSMDEVRLLLEAGADVNDALGDGMTALHWAARKDDPSLAELLIDAGAALESKTRISDHTPLHVAAKSGSGAVVEALVAAKANIHAVTTTGAAPIHFAATSGSARAVLALAERGADVNAKEPRWGQTPLMFAAATGRTESIEVLLEHGADPAITAKVVDVAGRSGSDRKERLARNKKVAERWAAERGVEASEDAGKSEQQIEAEREKKAREREAAEQRGGEPVPLNYAGLVGTYGGLTALQLAVREGHADTALALIKGGADINQPSGADNTTPMLIAMINGHFDFGMKLFEMGANPDLASDAGATPIYAALNMHWAPKARHPQPVAYQQQELTYLEVMERLLEAGVDPNVRLKKTLWYTTYNRDLLGVDRSGATLFWRAAHALDLDAMKLLLKYGADPNTPTIKVPERRRQRDNNEEDQSGLPPVPMGGDAAFPIHVAAGAGHGQGFAGNSHRHVPDGWLDAVKFLVEELGADVSARDHRGYNAVHHAAARGDNELIRYLVEKGADPKAIARNGQTTIDMANGPVQRVEPFPETIALLASMGAKNNHNCVSC